MKGVSYASPVSGDLVLAWCCCCLDFTEYSLGTELPSIHHKLSIITTAITETEHTQTILPIILVAHSGEGMDFIVKCLRRRQIVKILATKRQQVTYEHKSTKMQQGQGRATM